MFLRFYINLLFLSMMQMIAEVELNRVCMNETSRERVLVTANSRERVLVTVNSKRIS